jgi:hypothetical protein
MAAALSAALAPFVELWAAVNGFYDNLAAWWVGGGAVRCRVEWGDAGVSCCLAHERG